VAVREEFLDEPSRYKMLNAAAAHEPHAEQ